MALTAAQQAALTRLASYYEGNNPYNASNNPGGFRQGGQVVNFVPALQDVASAVQGAASLVSDALSIAPLGLDPTETDIASAATTDIGSVATIMARITGTTAITSFGTVPKRIRFVRFTGALTLTHDATKLILPGAANITTAAGDTCTATSDGNGVWTVRNYQKADGTGLASIYRAQKTIAANTNLAASDYEFDIAATASPTITMPNVAAGWKTGVVKNTNPVSGLVTLAVPSGATLDGITNSTTVLYPYQRARIVQTGATAYITDQGAGDLAPVLARIPPGAAAASWDIAIPVGYRSVRIVADKLRPGTAGALLYARLSDDSGATVKSGSSDYGYNSIYSDGGAGPTAASASAAQWQLSGGIYGSGNKAMLEMRLEPGGGGDPPSALWRTGFIENTTASQSGRVYFGGCNAISANRANLIRFYWSSGTGTGGFTVYGEP